MILRSHNSAIRTELGSLAFIRPLVATTADLIGLLFELDETDLFHEAKVRVGAAPTLTTVKGAIAILERVLSTTPHLRDKYMTVAVLLPRVCYGRPSQYRSLLETTRHSEFARCVRLVVGTHPVNLAQYSEYHRSVTRLPVEKGSDHATF